MAKILPKSYKIKMNLDVEKVFHINEFGLSRLEIEKLLQDHMKELLKHHLEYHIQEVADD